VEENKMYKKCWKSKNNHTVTKYRTKIRLKKHNRHQHNTDDGGQAMGEELI